METARQILERLMNGGIENENLSGPSTSSSLSNLQGDSLMTNSMAVPRTTRLVGRKNNKLSNEDRSRIIDLVINHHKSYKEVGSLLQLKKSTVASVIRVLVKKNRIAKTPRCGGRKKQLSDEEEEALLNFVKDHNDSTLKEMKLYLQEANILNPIGKNISLQTIHNVLKRNKFSTKTLDKIPEARNSANTINERQQYARNLYALMGEGSVLIWMDESGYNLHLRRRRGRNVIGKRAVVCTPTQRGGNISLCLALSEEGIIHHKLQLSPFNSDTFMQFLHEMIVKLQPPSVAKCVFIMDNVPFHRTRAIKDAIQASGHCLAYLPPYSPFLNPVEEAFSKVKANVRLERAENRETLLSAIGHAINIITVQDCRGWTAHAHRFLLPCLDCQPILNEVPE